jgi:long-subunit fatty acid transport protein
LRATGRLFSLFGALSSLLVASRAVAGGTHYQSYHVGERAAGMAGAFTALADEATGAYYNPAGMVDLPRTALTLTVSAYQLDLRRLDDQFSIGQSQGALSSTDFASFPSGFAVVRAFGDSLRQAAGLYIVVPDHDLVQGKVSFSGATYLPTGANVARVDIDATASFRQSDRSLWFGSGYALRPHPRIALGASLFYVLRHYQLLTASVAQGLAAGSLFGEANVVRLEALHGSFLGDLGLKIKATDHLRFGLAWRSPNLRIHRSGQVFQTVAGREPMAQGGADLEIESNEPFRVSLGIAWEQPRHWTMALDLRIHGAVSEYYPLWRRGPDGQMAPDATLGGRQARDLVVNVSVGGEYHLTPSLALRGGFYTDFTSVPELRLDGERSLAGRVHLWGLAAALAWVTEKTSLSLSVNYAFGFGETLGVRNGSTEWEEVVKSGASRQFLTLLLGGSYSL